MFNNFFNFFYSVYILLPTKSVCSFIFFFCVYLSLNQIPLFWSARQQAAAGDASKATADGRPICQSAYTHEPA